MLIYLLKFSFCLALFWAFYKLLLEKESFHSFKRLYLIFSIALSLVVPLITFTTYIDPVITQASGFSGAIAEEILPQSPAPKQTTNYLPYMLSGIYLIGVLFFAVQFIRNILDLRSKIRNNQKSNFQGITRVLLNELVSPHTFFSFIFYNKDQFENDKIPEEVHWHEETHAREKHSLDVLLVELLIIFCWFNPVLYFMRKSMKLNHEFLADRAVIRKGVSPSNYQSTLLAFTESSSRVSLANAINYSLIKKRFIIMKKQTKKSAMLIRLLLIIPVLAFLIYSCSETEVRAKPIMENPQSSAASEPEKAAVPDVQVDIFTEYNKLVKHYSTYPEYDFIVKVKDMIKIRKLYDQMTEAQRAKAEPYLKSTTSMTVFITNDGKYILEDKEVPLATIESIIQQLTREELSNAFIFASMDDTKQYIKERRGMNRSMIPPNDIYISIFSQELVNDPISELQKKGEVKLKKNPKFVNHASENEKLTVYLKELVDMFKKYGVNTY